MSGTRKHLLRGPKVEGVFILGMFDSGADLVHSLLCRLGLCSVGDSPAPEALARFNDRLLAKVGDDGGGVPKIAPREAARILAEFAGEARQQFQGVGAASDTSGNAGPWVWADPRNSFLASFWAESLAIHPAVILVHRDPEDAVSSPALRGPSSAAVLEQWAGYNRAAVVHCSELPALVLGYEELLAQPKAGVLELAEFMEECGLSITGGLEDAVEVIEGLPSDNRTRESNPVHVDAQYRILAQVLGRLDSRHVSEGDGRAEDSLSVVDATSSFYDENYYGTSYDQSGVPYRRGEKVWVDLFNLVASSIVDKLNPDSVLDVGCATGMLVEALRDRGVDAFGIDVSEWAIDQIPQGLRPFCKVGSITEELDGQFALITCTEVFEHLPPSLAAEAVANLCRHSDSVLFSSTPDDFDEPTHLNVEPGGYWAQLFFRQGFVRDVDFDATFVAPHGALFRRRQVDIEGVIADYERGMLNVARNVGARVEEAIAEHDRLADRFSTLNAEADRLKNALGDAERRRSAETTASFEMVRQYEVSQRRLAALVNIRDAELEAVRATKTFRYTTSLRRVYGWLRRSPKPTEPSPEPVHRADGTYELWIEQFDTLDDSTRDTIRARVAQLSHQPLMSVIMPVYNPPPELLRAAIDSVRGQLYANWELCIADDCSSDPHVAEVLNECESIDARIKVARRDTNGHISAASNTALTLATGEWVGCVDHDDVLAEHALALAALAIADHADAGIVYSDEDKLDGAGTRHDPYFKPDFDPLLLIGQNYLSHLCLFRRDLVTEVGGYREGYEGSQDWDLTLRVSELLEPEQVVHIPHVLYHWQAHAGSTASGLSAKPYAVDAGRHAATDHLARTGRPGRITAARIGSSGFNRVSWTPPEPQPLVSIIIPTRDGGVVLQRCIESVLAITTYVNFEVIVVDNASQALPTLRYLRENDARVTVIRDERPFNYSAINNFAARQTTGDLICLLNDDTEVISENWLTEMVAHVLQPGVGAVGAKLYYPDGRIQHGGVILGVHGVAAHSYNLSGRLSPGYFGRLQLAQHMSAVTAACMVVRREAWDRVGGLDEHNLPIAFNDVDFCLRLRENGWGVVWSPYAELFHHESVSRGADDVGPRAGEFAREVDYMQKRWGPKALRNDPSYNSNLTLVAGDFSLAWPPRTSYR
jgi:glycosyltransferase involved in cell wall biosynthesis/SAM-dependent methyltransferase